MLFIRNAYLSEMGREVDIWSKHPQHRICHSMVVTEGVLSSVSRHTLCNKNQLQYNTSGMYSAPKYWNVTKYNRLSASTSMREKESATPLPNRLPSHMPKIQVNEVKAEYYLTIILSPPLTAHWHILSSMS